MDFTFQYNTDFTLLRNLASRISVLAGINSVETKSSKEVLEKFKERHENDPVVLESLKNPKNENPF
ncbi:MAG: hypothetical protein Q7K26_00025 [bacterium]|nr:hypothetical protein [bacterium]